MRALLSSSLLLLSLVSLSLFSSPAHALRAEEAGKIDWVIQRIGVPRVNSLSTYEPWSRSSLFSPHRTPLNYTSHAEQEEDAIVPSYAPGMSPHHSTPEEQLLGSYPSSTSYISPRFHRIINPRTYKPGDKTQTAIYVATESNVLAALNPRNGAQVWRHVFEEDEPIVAFYTINDGQSREEISSSMNAIAVAGRAPG